MLKVLLIDDDSDFLEMAENTWEKLGELEVSVEESSAEALDRIGREEFDVVVSDYKMPEKTGLQILKELREFAPGIPFVLLTGKGDEEVAMEALNMEADRYVKKSSTPQEQVENIESAVFDRKPDI